MESIDTDYIFKTMLGTDNNERLKVEELLEKLANEQTEILTHKLLSALSSNDDQHIELGSLLLHKKILTKNDVFEKLSKETIQSILETVVNAINPSRKFTFLKRASEIIVQLYVNQDAYLAFFDQISKYENETDDKIKQFVLYSLELQAECSFDEELLKTNSQLFNKWFDKYMADESVGVRVAATISLTTFLSCIQETKNIMGFKAVLPNLLNLQIEAVKSDEEKGLKVIKTFEDLIQAHPKFVKLQLEDIINVFTEILLATNLGDGLRNAAVLCLATASGKNAVFIRKSETFCNKTIPALMNVILEQPDDLEEWLNEYEENSQEKNSVQANVIESLPRFAEALGVKFLLPKFIPHAFKFIDNEDWKHKYAGLMAIAMLVEGSNQHFEKDFDNLMSLFLPTLNHNHPKVSYASLTCLALLCDEYTPKLQKDYHQQVMSAILPLMVSENAHIKIKTRAISCMVNFARELLNHKEEKELLNIYSDQLTSNLVTLFQLGHTKEYYPLIEEVLTVLSILAELFEEKFANYYGTFMPALKTLLNTLGTENTEQMNQRQLTISTIGHLMGSFKENYQPISNDIVEVMNVLLQLQQNLGEDDGQHKAIIECYGTLTNSLKQNFSSFLPQVITYIIEAANTDIKVHMEDEGFAQNPEYRNQNYHQMVVDLKILGGKKVISLNHSLLEKKIAGFDTLFQILKVFNKEMYPYMDLVAPVIRSNLDNKHSSMVRKLGIKCLYYLMMCCTEDVQMANIFNDLAPIIIEKANQYLVIENDQEAHSILSKLLKAARLFKTQLITESVIDKWFEALSLAANLSVKLKTEIKGEMEKEDDLDDQANEEFDERFDAANSLLNDVSDSCGFFMKIYGTVLEQAIINKFGGFFYNITKNSQHEDELHNAICFYTDLMENSSEVSFTQGCAEVMNCGLNFWNNIAKDINSQHTVAFMIGVLAKRMNKTAFAPYLNTTLQKQLEVINHGECFSEQRADFTDNAIGALGKICLFQLAMDKQESVEVMNKFLSMMPIHHDNVEAQAINKLFLQEINNKNTNQLSFEDNLKQVLMKMNEFVRTKPELEILDDIGSNLLCQINFQELRQR